MTPRSFLILTLCVLIAEVLLISLGSWQLMRREWKHNKLDAMRQNQEKLILIDTFDTYNFPEFSVLELTGRFEGPPFIFPGKKHGEKMGLDIAMLFRLEDGTPVFIKRGFVPDLSFIPAENLTRIKAQVRFPQRPSSFTPDNDPAANQWYWMELDALAKMAGIQQDRIPPFYLEVLETDTPYPIPTPLWPHQISDNHLQYALTWFSLAFLLMIFYTIHLMRFKRMGKNA